MGSKRPADAGKGPQGQSAKRTKTNDAPSGLQVNKAAVECDPTGGTSSNSRLFMLKSLVQDVINDPNVSDADPEVMKAISQLGAAFLHSPEYSPSTQKLPTTMRPPPSSHHSQVVDRTGSQPPPLPPIPDSRLAKAAFTHPAYANDHDATYDRLEILGDAYIELISTKLVLETFPGIPAGRVSQIRELLVKNETLAGFAEIYHLDRKALVPANYSDQAKRWIKTKGDIFEAYVAAVVLSHPNSGYQIAEQWLTRLWQPKLHELGHQKAELRSKEELAKKVMAKGVKLEYMEEQPSIQKKGTGTQTFFIGVYLTGWGWNKKHLGSGKGPSKTAAGDEAAQNALRNVDLISEITTTREALIHRKE